MIKSETFNLMEAIQQFFPQFEITQSKIDLWHKALKDIEHADGEENLMSYVKYNRYPPTVSDIANQKKEEKRIQHIPNVEETKKFLGSNFVEKPVTKEEIREIFKSNLGEEWVREFEQRKQDKKFL